MAAGNLWVNLGLRSAAFDRGLNKSRKNIRGFGGQVQSLNRNLKGMAAALGVGLGLRGLGRALGSSVRQFATFQKGMAQVSTMLDDQTMKFMPAYEKQIRELAVEMGESTETLSAGLYDILSASVDASKAMKVLRVATKAAKAGITDTATAADAITTILNSYGMAAESATEVSDKMFATIKRGKLTFADYAPNIGKVAALAATAGLAFEDLNASISTLTRAGVQTEIAMTGIRQTIAALISPSKEAIEAAIQFGLVLDENTLRTTGLVGMMDKLRNASLKQLEAIIPNMRGMASFAAGLRQADGAMSDLTLQLNSHNLTQEAFSKMMATTATDLEIWKQKWAEVKIKTGSVLGALIKDLGTVKKLWKDITEVRSEWLKDWKVGPGGVWVPRVQAAETQKALNTRARYFSLDEEALKISQRQLKDLPPERRQAGFGTGAGIQQGFIPGAGARPGDSFVKKVETLRKTLTQEEEFAKHMTQVRSREREKERIDHVEGMQQAGQFIASRLAIEEAMNQESEEKRKARSMRIIRQAVDEANAIREANEKAAKVISDRWEWVGQGMASSMTSAFDQIVFEGGKFKDAMKSILRTIARDMAQAFIFTPFSEALIAGVGSKFGMPLRTAPVGHSGKGFVPNDGLYALQRGEQVNDRVSARGGGVAPVVVIENKGVPLQQEGPARFEADKWVISVVNDNIQNRGALYHATRT